VAVLSFVAAITLVLSSSLLIVARLHLPDPLDNVLAFITIGLALVLCSLLLAGIAFDDLTRRTVLLVNAATLVLLIGLESLRPSRRFPPRLALSKQRAIYQARRHPWLSALALLAAGEFAWSLVVAYVLPPYAFDALWYHLTTVAGWLQAQRMALNPLALWSSVYPLNGEVFFTWPAVFLRNDTFIDAVQLGFAAIGAIAVAGIARDVGLQARNAAAAGFLFFLTPIVISESTTNYVDLIFTSTFLLAFYFLLRFLRSLQLGRPDTQLVALAGIAAGIALGAKSLGLLCCGVLLLLLLGHVAFATLTGRVRLPTAVLSFCLFIVPLIALGGFWYARTWARFGNPVYPVRVTVLGYTLFGGLPLKDFLSTPLFYSGPWWKEVLWTWHQDQLGWVKAHYYTYDGRPSGFGPLWGYLAAPLLPAFALTMLVRNRAMFVNFLLPVIVVFLAQPYKWWSRFTLLLLAAGVIAVAYFVQVAPARVARALKSVTLLLVVVGLWLCTAKIDNVFTAPGILLRLTHPAERSRTRETLYGRALALVSRAPSGTRVAVDPSARGLGEAPFILYFYPLFGTTFDHRVYPLPARGRQDTLSYLAATGIDYVVVGANSRLAPLAEEATRVQCLRLAAKSTIPSARVYTVEPRCRGSGH
jgi:Dolichyl-phosphate-mannose-protein mannosyltransferase